MNIFLKKNSQCHAIVKETNKRCSKKSLKWSPYCFWHQPKFSTVITLIIGALLGLFLPKIYSYVLPSQNDITKERIHDRIALEATKSLTNFDSFLKQHFENSTFDLYKRIEKLDLSKSDDYSDFEEFNELNQIIHQTNFYLGANLYTKDKKQYTLISALLHYLSITDQSTSIFLDRYGSVDHEIVIIMSQLNEQLKVNFWIFDFVEKSYLEGNDLYRDGVNDQHADFFTDLIFSHFKCRQMCN